MLMTTLLAPITLVGLLTEQGQRGCEKGEETWSHPHFEVGFHPITLAEHLSPPPPAWVGGPVVVVGEPAPGPVGSPTDDQTCPPIQAREGCYGKPDALTETRVLGAVAVGGVAKAEVPARVTREQGRGWEHVLHSIQVLEKGHDLVLAHQAVSRALDHEVRPLPSARVVFDLDLPVRDVKCSERKPGRKIQLEP